MDSAGGLTVRDHERGDVTLPAEYVARHVELGWAVTGYGSQGLTVDHGICVVEPTTSRAGLYVGMTRGRKSNVAIVVDPPGATDPADTLAAIMQRPANAVTAHAMRDRLHGHPVSDIDDDAQRMRARLDRPRSRPAPTKVLRHG